MYFFFFKQKTAYELRISDWSSDVCSSDLVSRRPPLLKIACGMGSSLSREYLTRALQAAGITALFLKSLISWRSVPTLPPHRSALPTTSFAGIIQQIGRASCRESVCQYVSISVGAVPLKKHTITK